MNPTTTAQTGLVLPERLSDEQIAFGFELTAELVHRYNSYSELVSALRDCREFIAALAEMTEGGGEITKNSIVRPGQTLKHLAVIISNRATKTLHHTANATRQT